MKKLKPLLRVLLGLLITIIVGYFIFTIKQV